eukprot:scaffold5238_cov177-Amphora_coffeaeformis.AAC.11
MRWRCVRSNDGCPEEEGGQLLLGTTTKAREGVPTASSKRNGNKDDCSFIALFEQSVYLSVFMPCKTQKKEIQRDDDNY